MSVAASGKPGRPAPAAPPSRQLLQPSRRRSAPTARQLARRHLMVQLAKWLLPAAALALLASIVLWPELDRNEDRARYAFRRVAQPGAEALKVTAPRYQGIDELSRPYTVTADQAQQVGKEEVLDLTAPRADIVMTDGSWIYVQARQGRYSRPENHLDLSGAVTIYRDDGTMMRTDAAAVDLAQGQAQGDEPVAAQGPFGTLTSDGFRLRDRGAVVVFTGQAHAVLEGGRR